MTRKQLIKKLQEAMKTEESAVTIYAKHLSAIVSRSGLSESDVSQIKKIFETLIDANKKHKAFLESLLKRVQGESIDVY